MQRLLKKEEIVMSNSTEKLLKDEGYPFKKINEELYDSDGLVEEDWYEPRGTNSSSSDTTTPRTTYNTFFKDE